MDPFRRTGRTTRMLARALDALVAGENVLIVVAHHYEIDAMVRMTTDMLHESLLTQVRRDILVPPARRRPQSGWREWVRRVTGNRYFKRTFLPRPEMRFVSMHDASAWRGRTARVFVDHYARSLGALRNNPGLRAYIQRGD